jgi:hypothetical protein
MRVVQCSMQSPSTMSIYYSTDYEPLQLIAGPVTNNNTGGGQFHMGVFKLPTPPSGANDLLEKETGG